MPPASPEGSSEAPVHLVLGDAAAGCLRASWHFPGAEPGAVLVFRDVLALGPLDRIGTPNEAASRAAYWQQVMPGERDDEAEFAAEIDRYREAALHAASGARLKAWHGDHASSVLWLQRLANTLPQAANVQLIDASLAPFVPHPGAIRALGHVAPARVAELQALARPLAPAELQRLGAQWRENAARDSGLRRCRDGRILHHAADYYDGLLLAHCATDWRPAPRVLGETMEAADEILGDWFFAWRLRCLAQAGVIVLQGVYDEDLAFAVRLR